MQLARLAALSFGGGDLKKEHWEHVQKMEKERLARFPPAPSTEVDLNNKVAPAAAPAMMSIPMADDDGM